MKKLLYFIIFCLFLVPSISFSALPPIYKECVQRGYKVITEDSEKAEYCVFPDNSRCVLAEFNSGNCGKEFKIENYCVKEGTLVWDFDKCCSGTEAYLLPYHTGQHGCRNISSVEKAFNQLRYNPKIWRYSAGLLILVGAGAFLFFKIKKKNKT